MFRVNRKSKVSGKLIVFEGIDGSGKETQFRLFIDLLSNLNIKYKTYDFPQYDKTASGMAIKMVLRGELGVDPVDFPIKGLALYYALDRHAVAQEIRKILKMGYAVILNRYSTSNQGHQTWKFKTKKQREEFLSWLNDLEHNKLKIPKEDIVIFLDLSLKNAIKLIKMRDKTDRVELNQEYLRNSLDMYRSLAKKYPHWIRVNCEDEKGNLLSPKKIHRKLVKSLIESIP